MHVRDIDGATLALEAAPSPDGDCVAPLALYFSTGRSPNDHSDCRWELQTAADSQHEHYLIGRSPAVDFIGYTHSEIAGPPTCRYAIGVLNTETGALKYSEIQAGQVLRVEPQARSVSYDATESGTTQDALDREKLIAQNRRLVDAFGSTRRKRQLKQRDNAQVQLGAVGGLEAVASLLQTAGEKAVAASATKAEVLEKALGYRILPPHHADATRPQDAYRLQELEPKQVWDVLETQPLDEISADRPEVPEFIQTCYSMIRSPDSNEGKTTLRGLLYLNAALKLYSSFGSLSSNSMRGGMQAVANKTRINVEVLQCFLDAFYEASVKEAVTTFSLTDRQKTLLLMHILMVALIIQSYQMGPRLCEQLRQTIKIPPIQLSTLYREMGCVVKSNAPKGITAVGSPTRDLSILLLPSSNTSQLPPKKLADYFPQRKIAANKRGRR